MKENIEPVIVIIGAGQLGSRHLQALAESNFIIYVIDPSPPSLTVAEERFNEVNQGFTGQVYFKNDLQDVPNLIDIAIVATSSKVRAAVVVSLLKAAQVKYLILEKVLFPRLEEYADMADLFTRTNTQVWVNCPIRTYPFFKKLKKEMTGQKITMNVVGNNWGLGCNGIHMLDLFSFLTDQTEIKFYNDLDKVIHPSKRPGYIEFTGTLNGSTSNGDFISITGFQQGEAKKLGYAISTGQKHILIQSQKASNLKVAEQKNNWEWESFEEEFPVQSKLTGLVVNDLLASGNCDLTPYTDSAVLHTAFLTSLMQLLSDIQTETVTECLIT